LGAENVIDDADTLEAFSRDMSFTRPLKPALVLKPKNKDEVQKIIQWANQTSMPLVPVSSGGPHFRGDTVPGTGQAVMVDLSGMKKIIWISGRQGSAIVEPGVTFGELLPEVKKEGLRLNMPLLPRRSKSVLASLLEREPVTMPKFQWEDGDPMGASELIWGNGEYFKTGAAATLGGNLDDLIASKSSVLWPKGPYSTDYAKLLQGAQGTMGIVTWVSVRCEWLPSLQEPFLVGSPNLEPLCEFIYWLTRRKLADECLVLNNSNLAAILAQKWPVDYIRLRDNLPTWVLFFSINGYEYFPEEKIAYQLDDITAIAQRAGVQPTKGINGVTAPQLLDRLFKPSDEPYWKLRYKGACQDIFFLTTCSKVPALVDVMYHTATKYDYPTADMGVYLQPTVQGCNWHCEFNLFYDPNNSKESGRVQQLLTAAAEALMAAGAYFSRPYGPWADIVYRRDAESTSLLKKVKRIFDPNDIMNPGKLCF
jgi:FAD/FMN-containing dehydrogenase